ncbi:hypothetical protein [Nocardioides euryhalodurans]|uniref:LPXTG cell wall anchor domain-containing protein n=1 Tax=Nocardioides euryhalodurans TaxID=2518370 RepID=A0A4P7GK65_9ACTN|nr:hypothetical protein [Nocardioides euryhalodurans]QBR92164.1 hypothetical protein EXE57_07600 [Nocardioides euryhalodurans]
MSRGRARSLLAIPALLAPLLLTAPPAYAEHAELLVSTSPDGPFRTQLSQALFHDAGPFVPRTGATRTYYVKNTSPHVARTTVSLVDTAGSNAFEQALTFELAVGDTVSTGALGGAVCHLLATGPDLAPGEVQAVQVGVSVADLAGQQGMRAQATLDLVTTLSQVGPSGEVDVCGVQATTTEDATTTQDAPDDEDCERAAVVTVSGSASCVPVAVDGGVPEPATPAAGARTVAGAATVLVALGALLLIWGGRRRTDPEA